MSPATVERTKLLMTTAWPDKEAKPVTATEPVALSLPAAVPLTPYPPLPVPVMVSERRLLPEPARTSPAMFMP